MDTPIVVALIGGWSTIIAGLVDVRRRTNNSGSVTKKINEKFDSMYERMGHLEERSARIEERTARIERHVGYCPVRIDLENRGKGS